MISIFTIPASFFNFGVAVMNDYDEALYVRMIAARLPEEVSWEGDKLWIGDEALLADDVEDESDVIRKYDMGREWDFLADTAWEEWCACTASDATYLAAAEKYGLELPDDYNPGWDDDTHDNRAIYGDDYGGDEDDELSIGDILDTEDEEG